MISLPTRSAAAVKLCNFLIHKDAMTLRSHQQDWSVRFRVEESIRPVAASLHIAWGYHPLWIGLSEALLNELLSSYGENINMEFMRLPNELQQAVITPLIADFLDAAQQALGWPLTINQLHCPADQPPPGILLMGTVTGVSQTHLYVIFNESLATALLPPLAKLPERPSNLKDFSYIPIKARFVIGYTMLPLHEARAMTTGDVLIPDHCTLHPEPWVWIQLTVRQGYWARWQDHQLLLDNFTVQETTMTPDPPLPKSLDDVTLSVVFEIGEQTLTIGELARLQPGYTFTLDKTIAKPITLRVNGQRIGCGELVQIGDQLGVRIIELYSRSD